MSVSVTLNVAPRALPATLGVLKMVLLKGKAGEPTDAEAPRPAAD
jgi:hypothetical protein